MKLMRESTVAQIISRLAAKSADGAVKVEGTWGSFAPMLAACISGELSRPIVYVAGHIDDADKAADDLRTFGCEEIDCLPAWEDSDIITDATDEIRAERSRVSLKAATCGEKFALVSSVQSLCQSIVKPNALEEYSLQLKVGGEFAPEEIIGWLVDNGFEFVDGIEVPGQFARRGGIIDIYAPLVNGLAAIDDEAINLSQHGGMAIRIEFFGDTVESVRQVNLDTHRSSGNIESISIVSVVCGKSSGQREQFINILPRETILILEQPNDIKEMAELFYERSEDSGELYSWREIEEALSGFTQLHLFRFGAAEQDDLIKIDIKSVQQYQHNSSSVWAGHKESLEELVEEAKGGKKVYFYCESSAEINRISEIIKQSYDSLPRNFSLVQGYINQGFVISSLDTIIISHHEVFGQYSVRRNWRPARPVMRVDVLSDLKRGDYVVHVSYGIGKFLGIKTIEENGGRSEYLTIQYADNVKIQVSVSNIGLVQKYIGTSPKRPNLSRVGSKKWQKEKAKVAKSVESLASELLETQAKRQSLGGIAFEKDSTWQAEFEESFPYQETPDQITAMGEIKADMLAPIVMDRLLCGDVGYGKTELAMRAAFKAVESGKQVAMLVPTTVLCVQHGRTFVERFADFPICIEVLNRFKTAKQAADIIGRAKAGKVDILIGTHRILSKDVGFADLGLLIIDEEQRFGVTHKEKLKTIRVDVDVLTMTATPIPRTLHMSMLGLRDISSLSTAPLDRRSVVTNVTAYRDELVRKGIIRELNRQGQVFFLHNRVRSIEKKAHQIRNLIEDADAKVGIAHGQMNKKELEKAMIDFVVGKTNILVCTTIIESGLDIPNANTMFIDDADRFGLAQLHQLRGRVGRYKHRAYAYMLMPASRSITPIASRRLKAIEEYSHLGAGFRIALRDLEIRGAGNILGSAQSGHIQTVGYQMYCELLTEAVRKLKGLPCETVMITSLDLGISTYIPKNYIPVDRHRMDAYRKIAVARSEEELKQISDELADVYGQLPGEVELLLDLTDIRIRASKNGIKAIVISGDDLVFSFDKAAKEKGEFLFSKTSGTVRIADKNTVYLRLGKNYFEPRTLMSVLRKMFEEFRIKKPE